MNIEFEKIFLKLVLYPKLLRVSRYVSFCLQRGGFHVFISLPIPVQLTGVTVITFLRFTVITLPVDPRILFCVLPRHIC